MPVSQEKAAAEATDAAAAMPKSRIRRLATAIVWMNAISVTILVGGELFALSAALDWAFAGLLHLAASINYVLIAALFLPSALATWALFRRALAAERELTSYHGPAHG